MEEKVFEDRRDAGRQLAGAILDLGLRGESVLVLGIPRGGIVVANEVAEAISASLDVIIVRKIRAPYQPELGIGAVVDGDNICILNEELVSAVGASREYMDQEIAYQKREIERRLQLYRGNRPAPDVEGKTVIVVDDGIATGYTFRAALEGIRRRNPGKLVAAAPVAAYSSVDMLRPFADESVFLSTPVYFIAVGAWYREFTQVEDDEAIAILKNNWARFKPRGASND